jgi:hypothetical protein
MRTLAFPCYREPALRGSAWMAATIPGSSPGTLPMTPDPPPLGEGNLPILPMWTNAAGVADRFGGGEQRSAGAPPPQTVEPEVDPGAARRLNTLGSASESNGPAHAARGVPAENGASEPRPRARYGFPLPPRE